MVYVKLSKSNIEGKKYTAIFYNDDRRKIKTSHFGSAGMSDYTKHKDDKRKQRYLDRHRNNENWNDYMTPGALSRFILWSEPTFEASFQKYLKKFNLKKY
jgi:hypothetical protein